MDAGGQNLFPLFFDGAPHTVVQHSWSQLEREIRAVSESLGYEYSNSVVEMIDALDRHPAIDTATTAELHTMRRTRNVVAHDLDAPAPTAEQTEQYARRAFALAWYLSELLA